MPAVSGQPARVRVGIVGSGGMAEYNAKKFAALQNVVVAACSDRLAERAGEFARRLGIPKWHGSSRELAASGDVDCVATVVVDAGHALAALPALERKLPVFAEKPLARTLAEAKSMRAAGCRDSFLFGIQGDAGTIEADFTVVRHARPAGLR